MKELLPQIMGQTHNLRLQFPVLYTEAQHLMGFGWLVDFSTKWGVDFNTDRKNGIWMCIKLAIDLRTERLLV